MAFIKGHEFIVENKLGMIFNFYLNEQKHIECITSNKNRKWNTKITIFSNITESLHVDIDNKDNIHIVSYNENGSIYYHMHNDNFQWESHLIVQYPIEKQKIMYPFIKCINNNIHIFYYLMQVEQNNKAYLLHIIFDDKKYNTNHIATVNTNKYINQFKVFFSNNEILILYASVIDEFEQIFISKFDINSEKWAEPMCISSSKYKKIYIDSLLYNTKTLHFIWSNYDDEYLVVQYSKLDLNKITVDKIKPIPISTKSSSSFPTLVYYKKILWAIWTEMGKVISSYSNDLGVNWSEPYIDKNSKSIEFKRYRYITNCINNKNEILCDYIFGTLYPDIQFLGFGGEYNDEIPTK